MRFIIRTLVAMFGVWLASYLVPGMQLESDSLLPLLATAIIVGLVNAYIRPIIQIITFPFTVLTLGLFTFVINAFMLLIVGMLPWLTFQGTYVEMFIAALLGSLIISAVSMVANWFLPDIN